MIKVIASITLEVLVVHMHKAHCKQSIKVLTPNCPFWPVQYA